MRLVARTRVLWGRRRAGLALTALVLAAGVAAAGAWMPAGLALGGLGALMLSGVVATWLNNRGAPPPPGRILRIDGRRAHILAEGAAGGKHPVIWVAGGHGEGLVMHHLHAALREHARSILFDRTGSGWSDPARAPVTIPGEVLRLERLLEAAGETGPFVLAGHSFGGLFSVNFAHRHPERVAGIVLLDSTPPWNVAFAGRLSFSGLLESSWWRALAGHFGLWWLLEPEIDDPDSEMARALAGVRAIVNRHSVEPKSLIAEASVFESCMRNPLDLVIGRGALGDVPLVLLSANPTARQQAGLREQLRALGLDEHQAANLLDGLRDSADQQVALSSRGRHRLMPEGATHMFPYEFPEIVLAEVLEMAQASAQSPRAGSSPSGSAQNGQRRDVSR